MTKTRKTPPIINDDPDAARTPSPKAGNSASNTLGLACEAVARVDLAKRIRINDSSGQLRRPEWRAASLHHWS
jgi:hypothetical protein